VQVRQVRWRYQGHWLRRVRSTRHEAVEFFVTRILREKRACASCVEQGVATASKPVRIAPKSIFSDEVIIDLLVNKYCDAVPLYRQRAILMRDLGIDVALTTINDAVLRVGELLIRSLA